MTTRLHDNEAKLRLIHEVGFDRHFKAGTWAEYNRQFFDALAPKYDATNVLHSFGTKGAIDRRAVGRLPLRPGDRVLDVCTGSGDIAILLARAGASVTAIDASPEMLRVAQRKAGPLASRIRFLEGDALSLPFGDGAFDGAVISFGLRNLESLERGLSEMRRVVRPGGFCSNIDQGKPRRGLFNLLYEVQFKRIAPIVGKLVFHRGEFNSFRYLPESNRYFPDQAALCRLFEEVGFEDVANYDYWRGAVAQQVARTPLREKGVLT
jgi:demethylmenaquinone methyltransferase/2-methoxy-6-polyprenyl-1,4-benzoquinol methylase